MVLFKFNHLSRENLGEPKENISFTDLNIVSKPELPASYSVVPPAELNGNSDVLLKRTDDPVRPRHDRISGAVVKDCAWILKASELIAQDKLKSGDIVTCAGFNSSLLLDESVKPKANISILPLFPDKAASVAMVKHSMLLGKAVTEYFNPGQTPVQGMD